MSEKKTRKFEDGTRVFDERTKTVGTIVGFASKRHPWTSEDIHRYAVRLDGSTKSTTTTRSSHELHEIIPGGIRLAQTEPFIASTPYHTDVPLDYLEKTLDLLSRSTSGLELEPDFQRGHVWNQKQRERFVEYRIRGGLYGKDVWFNNVGWNRNDKKHPLQIVDGLQRLTAMRMFMKDEVRAFGQTISQWHPDDRRSIGIEIHTGLVFHVNNLPTRRDVLKWYLDLNAGGTPHSPDEIACVRKLLDQEPENTSHATKEQA